MNTDMTLTSQITDGCLIVTTDGYLNNAGGELIAAECYKHIDEGINKTIVDLTATKVVNSVGISILIEIIERLLDVEGKIVFTGLDPAVEKTFTIMGLFQFAGKAASLDEALSIMRA